MKQAVSEKKIPGKNFVLCGHNTKKCTPSAKKILKNGTRFGTKAAVNV